MWSLDCTFHGTNMIFCYASQRYRWLWKSHFCTKFSGWLCSVYPKEKCFFFSYEILHHNCNRSLEQVWNVCMWRCSSFFFTFWIHQWTDFFQVRGKFSVAWQIGGVLIFNPSVDCVCFFASPQVFLIHQWTVTITFPQRCMNWFSQWHVLTAVKILVQYWFSIHQWTVCAFLPVHKYFNPSMDCDYNFPPAMYEISIHQSTDFFQSSCKFPMACIDWGQDFSSVLIFNPSVDCAC